MHNLILRKEMKLHDDDFKELADIIHKNIGIVLGNHKKDMVFRRLSKRLIELNMSSFSEYLKHIKNNDMEQVALSNAITTNLTSFFRESHHFDYLKQILPSLLSKTKKLMIWSAGCSSGCEPYSIAMVIEKLIRSDKSFDIRILATDVDTNMLGEGRAGIYNKEIRSKIPPEYKGFIKEHKDRVIVIPEVRQYVHFKRLNLLEAWPMKQKYNIIFCRNTVIYFDKPTQSNIFNRFSQNMSKDGYLFIGHSESISRDITTLTTCGRTIYRKVL